MTTPAAMGAEWEPSEQMIEAAAKYAESKELYVYPIPKCRVQVRHWLLAAYAAGMRPALEASAAQAQHLMATLEQIEVMPCHEYTGGDASKCAACTARTALREYRKVLVVNRDGRKQNDETTLHLSRQLR